MCRSQAFMTPCRTHIARRCTSKGSFASTCPPSCRFGLQVHGIWPSRPSRLRPKKRKESYGGKVVTRLGRFFPEG